MPSLWACELMLIVFISSISGLDKWLTLAWFSFATIGSSFNLSFNLASSLGNGVISINDPSNLSNHYFAHFLSFSSLIYYLFPYATDAMKHWSCDIFYFSLPLPLSCNSEKKDRFSKIFYSSYVESTITSIETCYLL